MEFTKITGLGNDYLYINLTDGKNQIANNDIPKISRYMSNRHFGVGADGIILIEKSKIADFKMRIFNQDGSEAQMCGNGIRGVAKYVYDNKLTTSRSFLIETLAGIKAVRVYTVNGKVNIVEVNMGKANFEKNDDIIPENENIPIRLEYKIDGKKYIGTYVSMGNPHFVIFENNIEELNIEKIGKIIEDDKHFPNRVNVEFVKIIDKGNLKVRVWERGSGETYACGTGACASAMVANLYKMVRENVKVYLKGGKLDIKINKDTKEIFMTGMTTKVFDGIIKNSLVNIV